MNVMSYYNGSVNKPSSHTLHMRCSYLSYVSYPRSNSGARYLGVTTERVRGRGAKPMERERPKSAILIQYDPSLLQRIRIFSGFRSLFEHIDKCKINA